MSAAFALLAGAVGYWGVVAAPELIRSPNDAAVIAASRTVPRGRILDRDGNVLAAEQEGLERRLLPGLRRARHQPGRRLCVGSLRPSGPRARVRRRTVRAWPAIRWAISCAKFGTDRYDPKAITSSLSLDLQTGGGRGPRRPPGSGGDARPEAAAKSWSWPRPRPTTHRRSPTPATSRTAFEALRPIRSQPLLPRATLGRYVPGSVFKIVTAVAALGSGRDHARHDLQPAAKVGGGRAAGRGFRVRDGHHPSTGSRRARPDRAPPRSRATSITRWPVCGRAAPDLVDYAARMGFGAPLPFDLPTAVSQVTNGTGSAARRRSVDDVELANAAYGQAETFVTPLQMALVASTIANGGELMQPRLVTSMTGKAGGTRTVGRGDRPGPAGRRRRGRSGRDGRRQSRVRSVASSRPARRSRA